MFQAAEGKTKGKGKAKEKTDDEDATGQINADVDEEVEFEVAGGSDASEDEGDDSAEEAVQWPEEEDAGLPSFSALDAEELDEVDDEENVEPEDTFDGAYGYGCLAIAVSGVWLDRGGTGRIRGANPRPDSLLPEWKAISLHSSLKRSLLASGFVKPTNIQARSLPAGLAGRDVVGVAETVCRLMFSPVSPSLRLRPITSHPLAILWAYR